MLDVSIGGDGMANIKNLSTERYKAHEFLSEFAEHVGEDKLYDNGRSAKFHKRNHFREETRVSELMLEAQKKREVVIEKEKTERQQFAGFMKRKEVKDKYAPKDY